ncbi:TonB-dependent receptor [Sphingosinicella rhizophila]|uniref:TonB-dependent receptor n=1 Tax=Sphingosinicella rhizophila TaxID=3050082 RepID=A0ABU3Q9M0_9SPHN|nr:TonB-dependent receptor [Sphingosinicella sp. GR2756]MDT9600076.1 TonB-dependent receptor [Sphingosinicella sp. GR2756]
MMMSKSKVWKVAMLAGTMLAAPALAQPAADQPPAAEDGAADDGMDIVVTAQQRSERLQEVPIQVTAFSAQRIEDAGIKSTADVIAQVPNVTFDTGNNYRSSFITMRGLTQINNADPPIAFVLDGVPQTNQETIGVSLFDVERIEVLKGPQGALYGRNAVGGAINVITKQPSNEVEGFANGSFASGQAINAAAGISGPIVDDKLLFRVSGSYKSRDGQIDNDFLGDEVDFIDHDVSVRGRLLFRPSDPLTIDLRAEHGDYRAGSNYYSAIFSGDPNDFVDPQMNFKGFSDGRNTDLTAKIDYDLAFATLTSITSHGRFAQKIRADLDFRNPVDSPGGFFGLGFQLGQGQNQRITTTSQEIRLVSASNQRVRWLAGGYYLHTKRSLVTRGFFDLDGDPGQFDNPALWLINKSERGKNDAYAGFAQVDFDITPSLTLTGGLRYDHDRRRQTNVADDSTREESFDHWQPKVTATWKIDDDRLVYATYSTGFRSGGFNAPDVTVTRFDQETLRNYELGFKSQFADRKFTLNGAAFMTDVRNYQFFYVDAATASQVIDTIDKVRIKGLELELIARLARGLDAAVAIGVLDSEIKRSLFPEDVGNKAPRTVPFSATSSLQYRTALSGNVEGFGRIEWQHFGRKYWSADNAAVQNAYDIVNLRLGAEFGAIGIYGFVNNLFDDHYYGEFFQPKYSGLDVAIGFPGARRSFGIEAKVKF